LFAPIQAQNLNQLAFECAGFFSVQLSKAFLAGGHFGIHVNGADRANRLASAALDTLIRMDVELVFTVKFIDTVNGTDADAGFVFNVDARFGNYEWHNRLPPIRFFMMKIGFEWVEISFRDYQLILLAL
jgi:hypothetical protein